MGNAADTYCLAIWTQALIHHAHDDRDVRVLRLERCNPLRSGHKRTELDVLDPPLLDKSD
jgi:hypothetical protein